MTRRLLVVATLALAFTAPASAALDARLTVEPREPIAGSPATILLRPYWQFTRQDGSCCRLVPAKVRYPFRLEALGPTGRAAWFKPTRTANPYVWRARYRFRASGTWRIRITNYYSGFCFPYSQRSGLRARCEYRGPELRVRVKPAPSATQARTAPAATTASPANSSA